MPPKASGRGNRQKSVLAAPPMTTRASNKASHPGLPDKAAPRRSTREVQAEKAAKTKADGDASAIRTLSLNAAAALEDSMEQEDEERRTTAHRPPSDVSLPPRAVRKSVPSVLQPEHEEDALDRRFRMGIFLGLVFAAVADVDHTPEAAELESSESESGDYKPPSEEEEEGDDAELSNDEDSGMEGNGTRTTSSKNRKKLRRADLRALRNAGKRKASVDSETERPYVYCWSACVHR